MEHLVNALKCEQVWPSAGVLHPALYGPHRQVMQRQYIPAQTGREVVMAVGLHKEVLVAMESDRSLPLIEQVQELLRTEGIIAPALAHLERLVWIVLKAAEKRLFRQLTADLTNEWGERQQSCPQHVKRGAWRRNLA